MPMIEVQELTKYFGAVLAVDRVSFSVDKGEVVGLLGPNGAGKTTTMRILTTYLPATSGVAKLAGFDVFSDPMNVRRNLGYLPESVPLYPEMRVDEYLAFRAKLKGIDRRQRRHRMEYCMDRCRIQTVRRRLIGTLSRGYRQRVGLAEAMLHDPLILILDEPTAGLDVNQQEETLELIRELGQMRTVLLSTHILPEVERVCKRVIIINQGEIALQERLANIQRESLILVEVRAPVEAAGRAVEGVPGVLRATRRHADEPSDGIAAFEVRTADNSDLRLAIAEKLGRQGWTLRRLDLVRRSLRDVYLEVTIGARAPVSAQAS